MFSHSLDLSLIPAKHETKLRTTIESSKEEEEVDVLCWASAMCSLTASVHLYRYGVEQTTSYASVFTIGLLEHTLETRFVVSTANMACSPPGGLSIDQDCKKLRADAPEFKYTHKSSPPQGTSSGMHRKTLGGVPRTGIKKAAVKPSRSLAFLNLLLPWIHVDSETSRANLAGELSANPSARLPSHVDSDRILLALACWKHFDRMVFLDVLRRKRMLSDKTANQLQAWIADPDVRRMIDHRRAKHVIATSKRNAQQTVSSE